MVKDLDQSTLVEKVLTWFTVLGYSPSLWENQGGVDLKQLVIPIARNRETGAHACLLPRWISLLSHRSEDQVHFQAGSFPISQVKAFPFRHTHGPT